MTGIVETTLASLGDEAILEVSLPLPKSVIVVSILIASEMRSERMTSYKFEPSAVEATFVSLRNLNFFFELP